MGLFSALGASACAVAGDGEGESAELDTVADVEQEIRNGTVVLRRGVVEIKFHDPTPEFPNGHRCTGALIGPRFLITAAHCLDGVVPRSTFQGELKVTVRYFDPDTGKRRITGDGETAYGFMKSTWSGSDTDTESDIAVIQRISDWTDTDTSDFLRLSKGSCSQIDRSDFYGRGAYNDAGDTDGQLRTMPINVHWCGEHHFFDLEGSRAICSGDSGGPYIMNTDGGGGFDVITGLASNVEISDHCAVDGGKQRAVRMNGDKVGWIESVMGESCHPFTNNGHSYERCF